MTPPGRPTDEQMKNFVKNQIPPKRSFAVMRRIFVLDESTGKLVLSDQYERIVVEAHNHNAEDSGALIFSSTEFKDKGLQGPGCYTYTSFTLAPGVWAEVREITNDMQTRSVAN